MEINLQEAYNILSAVGFGICMYKIYKLEQIINLLKTNQFLSSMANLAVVKVLKEKEIIGDKDLEIEIKQEFE